MTETPSGKGRGRGPVVHLDRSRKAAMIEAIVADHLGRPVRGLHLLDVGAGNGEIGEHFAAAGNEVSAVDIADQRRDPTGAVRFRVVADERLPFDDGAFDVVLSHHVIEHVADQDRHLAELRRVCRGVVYLATPNRSSPIMEGHVGNDLVLRWPEMRPRFEAAGFRVDEYGWRVVTEPDRFVAEQRFGRFLPGPIARRLRRFYPSHLFVLTPTP